MHKLLLRQVRRHLGELPSDEPWRAFLEAVDAAYREADQDRELLEHSMEEVSRELLERQRRLKDLLAESRVEQQATQGALSLLRATIDATADGILVVNLAGRIVLYNRRFAAMWRLPESLLDEGEDDRALELALQQLVEPEAFLSKVRELYADLEAESYDVLRFRDGRVFERLSMPQRMGGRPAGRVWSFRDVTERHHLEAQLRQAQKMEAVGQLAGGVAHDFNNALTVIGGHCELMLLREDFPESLRQDAEVIAAAADRAAGLTRQLLAFSRRQMLRPVVLDLNELVERLAPMLRRLLGEDIAVVTSHGTGNTHVQADAAQLEQVVLNLAVNARDAMPEGGMLSIGVVGGRDVRTEVENLGFEVAPGRYVQLIVRDTGTGIPKELQPRIFEPFFTTKEAGRGTGLGLATVYGTVKQSGGYITLESEAGRGAAFTVALPEADPVATPQGDSRHSARGREAKGTETVLLAEDEDSLRALGTRILTDGGYAVLAARDAREAIEQEERHAGPIHLLVTDVVMPGVSGRMLIEQIRARRPGIRVLYMSGHTDDEIVRRGVLDADVPFLGKPFSPWMLLQAVRRVLDAP